jgi:hypothetical protein
MPRFEGGEIMSDNVFELQETTEQEKLEACFDDISFTSLPPTDPVDHTNRVISETPLACPFTIAIDTREQSPFHFIGLRADSKHKYRPLVIDTETKTLKTGDYSIVGLESEITIERKSKDDAFQTFTRDRERFERELIRMQSMRVTKVVIECSWEEMLAGPKRIGQTELHSETLGYTVICSIEAWSQRFPKTHWLFAPSRQHAIQATFRTLERYWLDRQRILQIERNLI